MTPAPSAVSASVLASAMTAASAMAAKSVIPAVTATGSGVTYSFISPVVALITGSAKGDVDHSCGQLRLRFGQYGGVTGNRAAQYAKARSFVAVQEKYDMTVASALAD